MSEYNKCTECGLAIDPAFTICDACIKKAVDRINALPEPTDPHEDYTPISKVKELIEQYIDMGETAVVPVHEIIGDLEKLIKEAEGR